MNMKELADRMDRSVEALVDLQRREATEHLLIQTAAHLLEKLKDRDREILRLREQKLDLQERLDEINRKLDGPY